MKVKQRQAKGNQTKQARDGDEWGTHPDARVVDFVLRGVHAGDLEGLVVAGGVG